MKLEFEPEENCCAWLGHPPASALGLELGRLERLTSEGLQGMKAEARVLRNSKQSLGFRAGRRSARDMTLQVFRWFRLDDFGLTLFDTVQPDNWPARKPS